MSTEPSTSPTTDPATLASPQAAPAAAAAAAPSGCGCLSRRESLAVAGLAVAGTAGLAACSGSAGDAVSSAASAASGAIKAADIPVGGGRVFDNLKVVVTQPTKGDYKAFTAICTHQGCTVQSVANNVITCPCHGSEFDAATGAVKRGPATAPLAAKKVTVGADGIQVT
jgi:Rieske Fe-S protein